MRHLSIPEQALAASQGSSNTHHPPVYLGPTNSISGASCNVIPEAEITIFQENRSSISAHHSDGKPYVWIPSGANYMSLEELDEFSLVNSTPQQNNTTALDVPPPVPSKNYKNPYYLRRHPEPSWLHPAPTPVVK